MVLKNEVIFLAKMAVVFSVVDGLIPRAETLAKSKMSHHHRSQESTSTLPRHIESHRYHPHQKLTELQMGTFDLNPFHGSGSGGTKEALDEQWEVQQEILRARRGDKGHYVKQRKVESPKVEIKAPTSSAKGHQDLEHESHHHAPKPKFFWGLGK